MWSHEITDEINDLIDLTIDLIDLTLISPWSQVDLTFELIFELIAKCFSSIEKYVSFVIKYISIIA